MVINLDTIAETRRGAEAEAVKGEVAQEEVIHAV